MDIMKAIQKPFSDPKTLLIGAILGMIPIVNILVSGFALKVAQDSAKGNQKLRAWAVGDIVDYIVKAIMAAIIGIVYMIIPAILIIVGAGAAILAIMGAAATNSANVGASIISSLAIGGPFILVGVILAVIAMIILPMALLKWLKKGSFGEAFAVGGVVKNVLTADYIIGLIVSVIYGVVVMVVATVIGMVLAFIPIIGWIIALLVMGGASFAMMITTWTILAQTVK